MKFFTWFYPNLIVGRIVIAQISVSPEFIMKNTVHVTENYYSNPPAKSEINHISQEIGTWTYDDWNMMNSTNINQTIITDNRWESFQSWDGNYGCSLKNNVLISLSVCTYENVTFELYSKDHSKVKSITLKLKDSDIFADQCKWSHYSILKKENTTTFINEYQEEEIIIRDFNAFWLHFSNVPIWKLHDYMFKAALKKTTEKNSSLTVTFRENLCLSLFISVDKDCFLDINLESNDSTKTKTVNGFNEDNSYKTWKHIEIHVDSPRPANLSFFRGGLENGYWAIDDLQFCNSDNKTNIFKKESPSFQKIKNLEVYSKNSSSLWTRFQFSDSSYKNIRSYYISSVHENDSMSETNISIEKCEIWDNFFCGIINDLKPETKYKITVKRNESEEFNSQLSSAISVVTIEDESEAPENLHLTWSNDYVFVTWNHPFVTNGPVKSFQVVIETNGKIENKTVDVTKLQKNYRVKMSVHYFSENMIKVFAQNLFIGKESKMNATFFPPLQTLSLKPFIEVCRQGCGLMIPKPNEKHNTSNYTVLITNTKNIIDDAQVIQVFKNIYYEKSENEGWLVPAESTDENYLYVKIGFTQREMFSLTEKNEFSVYLIETVNAGYTLVYPIRTSSETDDLVALLKSNVMLIAAIVSIAFLGFCLLLYLLLHLKRKVRKNNSIESVELLKPDNDSKGSTLLDIKRLKMVAMKSEKIIQEFRSLPKSVAKNMLIGLQHVNKNKNKDRCNIPYDCTRVVLYEMEGMGTDDYINASYINGFDQPKAYIAAQSPKFSTIRDFWRMIWQEQVETIVMATNFMENKKRKCAEYFPQRLNTYCEYGEMTIKLTSEAFFEHFDKRIFEISYRENERQIQHFHLKWCPDSMTPVYPDYLVSLVKQIQDIRKNTQKPIVIHCSSGMNRTGVLILCDLALRMVEIVKYVDFYTLLKNMRNERPNMIHSEKHYVLVHLVVLECLMEEENVFKKSIRDNFSKTVLKNQLDYLERLRLHDEIIDGYEQPTNPPYLYLDSYQNRRKFLITQQPTKNLLCNFWKRVVDKNIQVILFLSKTTVRLWPFTFQHYDLLVEVKQLNQVSTKYCTFFEFTICKYKNEHRIFTQSVKFFQMDVLSQRREEHDFIMILDDLHNTSSNDAPILVACHDGITASGLLVTLSFIIDKHQNEMEIDVRGAIRCLRRYNPKFIRTQEEMEVVYKAIMYYLQKFDRYIYVL